MKAISVIVCMLLSASLCPGTTYTYPPDKRPSLSIKEACGIGEKLLVTLGLKDDFYILEVFIFGDEIGSGAGTWHLDCRNAEGDEIHMSIHFPEDFCFVQPRPDAGNPRKIDTTERGFTRDGQVSEKWLKMQQNRPAPAPRPKVMPPMPMPDVEHESKSEAEQIVPSDGHEPRSHASSADPTAPSDAH